MITARFHLTAPLSHSAFGADAGNAVPLRRFPIVSLPDRPSVPAVSGNALRGGLRRALMRELLDTLGLNRDTCPEWDKTYAALANGGTITAAEKRLEPARVRAIREAVPALSVLGSALYTWLLPGHVRVGVCWPMCRETVAAALVPASDVAPPASEIEDEYSTSRLPDVTEQDVDATGVGPMPTTAEVIRTGTTLVSQIGFARHASETERSAVAHGLTLLSHLGGKSGSGLGSFRLEHDGDPQPYRAWLANDEALAGAKEAILAFPETW